MSQAFVSMNRLRVIVLFILFAFLVLCGRLFYLHVIDSERLKSFAENVRKSVRILASQRGIFLMFMAIFWRHIVLTQ